MSSKSICFVLLVLPLFSGCAPLQQAPLVYSSKLVIGADISTPTSESPGVSVSLGVKSVDAAYVPIAISKDGWADVKLVKADNGITVDTPAGSQRDIRESLVRDLEVAATKLAEADAAMKDAKSNSVTQGTILDRLRKDYKINDFDVEKLKKSIAEKERMISEIKQKEQLQSRPVVGVGEAAQSPGTASPQDIIQPSLSPPPTGLVTQFMNQLNDLTDQKRKDEAELVVLTARALAIRKDIEDKEFDVSAAATKLSAEEKSRRSAETVRDTASERLKNFAIRHPSTNNKSDALSVYGRFNSEATASGSKTNTASTSLTGGKIFSTGVASQHLTEAAREAAIYGGISDCIAAIKSLKSSANSDLNDSRIGDIVGSVCNPRVSTPHEK
jgi:hypothetical protein